MEIQKIIASIVLIAIGVFFFFNNKNLGKGTAKFYRKLYTEKNLTIMFRAAGVLLLIGGVLLLILK